MQYLFSVIDESTTIGGTDEEMAAVDVFNKRLQDDGTFVFAGGLGESIALIDNRAGAGVVTDGPYAESKEHVGGFWILECADADAARSLGIEASKVCNRKVEVRPFL